MDAATYELLKGLLSDAAQSQLSEKIVVFFMAWFFVKRTITQHLSKIEVGLATVAQNLGDLKEALTKVETSHSTRIQALESGVKELKESVSKIETKGG